MKKCLTRTLFLDSAVQSDLVNSKPASEDLRVEGKDWPTEAETMIGLKRLDNIQFCAEQVIQCGVPGDFVEAGVWRGGASIFMRAILKAYGIQNRRVWLADSFAGLPRPDPERYPKDAGDTHFTLSSYLAVSLDDVKKNFAKYGLLDDQVSFLKGWFRDTLPKAPVERISVLRLDGDMYESTMEAFEALYDRVTPGGFIIVDDYGCLPNCKAAVEDFRLKRQLKEPIIPVDWTGVYWQKQPR